MLYIRPVSRFEPFSCWAMRTACLKSSAGVHRLEVVTEARKEQVALLFRFMLTRKPRSQTHSAANSLQPTHVMLKMAVRRPIVSVSSDGLHSLEPF